MRDITTEKLNRMGRRRFIKTLSSLGISGAAVTHMSKEALADLTNNPEKEIPRLKALRHTNHEAVIEGTEAPDLEPIYYTIPRDEFVRVEGTYNAAKKLDNRLGNPDSVEFGVKRSEGRGDELIISVEHQTLKRSDGKTVTPDISLTELKQILPDATSGEIEVGNRQFTVEDIQVEIEEASLVDDDHYYTERYRPVPGGCAYNDGCTIGHPAYDNDAQEYVWTTAAHCVDRNSDVDVYQPYSVSWNDNYIGKSDKIIPQGDGDAATVLPKWDDTASNVEYRYAEDDGSYTDWFIYGTRSTDYLKDMAANGESVYKQGKYTGRLYGKVLKVSSDEEWVTIDCDRHGGDSGGPYFDVNAYDEAYAVGLHKMGVDYDDDGTRDESKGNTMQFVNNYLNLSL